MKKTWLVIGVVFLVGCSPNSEPPTTVTPSPTVEIQAAPTTVPTIDSRLVVATPTPIPTAIVTPTPDTRRADFDNAKREIVRGLRSELRQMEKQKAMWQERQDKQKDERLEAAKEHPYRDNSAGGFEMNAGFEVDRLNNEIIAKQREIDNYMAASNPTP